MNTEAVAPVITPHIYIESAYLALEATAEIKHELVQGNLIDIAVEPVIANAFVFSHLFTTTFSSCVDSIR